ncbi:hypothetical protein [Bacillus smithii]|uniref:Uncharacterized protein n=1 Tax=Bacillus smithii 7_3_47FAA TaxID=665952 RepID=G9QHK8_9BACI|nr:hypothetical protein [Bacillus smithii]EHL79386.1 hypothetical protein HMPREF1015_01267 [Bacillus smithii 7_3_47FAA]
MSIMNLKIINNDRTIDLPDWIKFAFTLGFYLNDHGIKDMKPINIIISLPSDRFFPLFVAMGILDKTFSVNKQEKSIRQAILNLKKGSRIIYHDGKVSRKVSVVSFEPSTVLKDQMLLMIKGPKVEIGVPEQDWLEKFTLLDEEYDEVKRTRKVSKKFTLGVESPLLVELYTKQNLNKLNFYPGDKFYMVGNTSQLEEDMNEKIFTYNNKIGSIKDFLYIHNNNSYTNGKFFSSRARRWEYEIQSDIPVIFANINSYLKKSHYFKDNPKIIITDRTDFAERMYLINQDIERDITQHERKIVTSELVKYLELSNIVSPKGIEFLAWR